MRPECSCPGDPQSFSPMPAPIQSLRVDPRCRRRQPLHSSHVVLSRDELDPGSFAPGCGRPGWHGTKKCTFVCDSGSESVWFGARRPGWRSWTRDAFDGIYILWDVLRTVERTRHSWINLHIQLWPAGGPLQSMTRLGRDSSATPAGSMGGWKQRRHGITQRQENRGGQ